jgi:hypothetical protein
VKAALLGARWSPRAELQHLEEMTLGYKADHLSTVSLGFDLQHYDTDAKNVPFRG